MQELSLTALLAEAVSTGCSEKEAAIAQGYEPSYWSRVKSGEKAAQLDRIGRLPKSVQKDFVARWARQLQMKVTYEDASRAAAVELVQAAARFLGQIA